MTSIIKKQMSSARPALFKEERIEQQALLGNLLTFLGNKLSNGSEAQAEQQQQLQPTGGSS
jgi:hypothetical protein